MAKQHENQLTPPIEDTPQAKGEQAAADTPSQQVQAIVEAILFASDCPLSAAKIAQVGQLAGQRAVRDAIAALNARYEQSSAAFHIETIAGGYQILTQPQFNDVLSRLRSDRSDSRLSQAAMETLAIVAYRQPILRADVEAIRGVGSGEVLRSLLEKQLIKIVGRAEVLGRPMLYGTTKRFLEVFGLAGLEDLPRVEELRSGATAGKTTVVPAPAIEKSQGEETSPTTEPKDSSQ